MKEIRIFELSLDGDVQLQTKQAIGMVWKALKEIHPDTKFEFAASEVLLGMLIAIKNQVVYGSLSNEQKIDALMKAVWAAAAVLQDVKNLNSPELLKQEVAGHDIRSKYPEGG